MKGLGGSGSQASTMKIKVSDIIADFLAEKEMAHVFGIVGAGNAHVFDSVTGKGATQIVCTHHEQAAVMAAMTYFRTSGRVSAALLTTGAGSLNGVTGVGSAWMDSIPCLILSGNENSKFTSPDNPLRAWGIQGYDSTAMVQHVTKHTARVTQPERIRYELEKAYFIAQSGRPGPVWVDVPMNIQSSLVEEEKLEAFDPAEMSPLFVDIRSAVEAIVSKLRQAKRPVLWLGHGIRLANATELLEPLLQQVAVPALVSWAGIDMIASDHPLVYGRAGVYGQRSANFVLQNADCVLTIGTRLAVPQVGYDISELARGAQIFVVDIDPTELEKYPERFSMRVRADAGDFLRELLAQTREAPIHAPGEWVKECDELRAHYPWVGPEHRDEGGFINSYPFMARLEKHFKPDQIVVTDMGTALLSGHQVLSLKDGQRLMTSTGLGEMGFGLPAAIGASFARQENGKGGEVLCLNCDGGMMLNLQELQTIVHHELPIKIIVFSNDGYLMIKHTQTALFKGRHSGTDAKSGVSCPNFRALGRAFGMRDFEIRTWDDFERVMPEFQAHDGPAICEVFMHPEQPFVPKLSLAVQKDGSLISPPLEDLSPFLPREELKRAMRGDLHAKSHAIEVEPLSEELDG